MRECGNFSPKILKNPALLGDSNLTRECEYRCEPKRHRGREGGQGEWKRKSVQKCVIPLLSAHRGDTAMTSTKETVGAGGSGHLTRVLLTCSPGKELGSVCCSHTAGSQNHKLSSKSPTLGLQRHSEW